MLSTPPRLRALLALILLVAIPSLAAEFERRFETDAKSLVVHNLVGQIRVAPTSGNDFEIVVSVRGEDADPDLLELVLEDGRDAEFAVRFPVDDHRDYVYPELGRGNTSTIYLSNHDQEAGWLERIKRSIGGEKIAVRGSGRGLEVWADIELRVPAGRAAKVFLGIGEIEAREVDAELVLDTNSGSIDVRRHVGDLVCDTGSGRVDIEGVQGSLLVDTGSGAVTVAEQRGGSLKVDTGSGAVVVRNVDTDNLHVDTGSGSVVCTGISCDKALIDTGSGAVELVLDRMGPGRFVIDTGSGGVHLSLPDDASATISVDTGSGGIKNRIAGAEVLHKERGEMKLRVGGGEARVVVDTGSGGVTIASR